MDELLEQFLIEGRDLVAEAHAALVVLGRDPHDRAALDGLFRATHTLKGSVALFDMAPAEALLHAAESRLDLARKGDVSLDAAVLDALVAVIDQTDRWIDAMEQTGALGPGAQATAGDLAITVQGEDHEPAPIEREAERWLETLLSRPQFASVDSSAARTAFCYAPDTECFFRGEDPLALVAAVPGLVALAVLPAADAWPDIADWEPFRCISRLEGVSSAGVDDVRLALRLVHDQVRIAPMPERRTTGLEAEPVHEQAITLRVDAAKLDRLADRSGELGVAVRALEPIAQRLHAVDPALAAAFRAAQDEIERVASALTGAVAQVRLVPLEPVLRRLPRLARDAAASLGKTLRFSLSGEALQADKQIADQLFEPLLHLVRNAIDHGLESPAERQAAGKPAEGDVRLSIAQQGDRMVITLSDDGRGIDAGAIRDSAVAKGLLSRDDAAALDDDEARRLIFIPGFSTATVATSLSGRGVGMDAVKASVERLGGTVVLDSAVNTGTRVTLRLPVTAMTTPLLMVRAGGQPFGLRLDHVVETTRIAASAIHAVGRGRACVLRDETVPVLDLGEALDLGKAQGDHAWLVVVDPGSGRTALRVSRLDGRLNATVKAHDGLLARLPGVAGTTMMADGSVLLVLDLPEIVA